MDTFDVIAGAVHPQAPLQPAERVIIEDPLARIMARADSAKLGRYVSMVDPLLLGVGLFLYVQRVAKLAPKKTAQVTQTLKPTPESDPRAGAVLHQVLRAKEE